VEFCREHRPFGRVHHGRKRTVVRELPVEKIGSQSRRALIDRVHRIATIRDDHPGHGDGREIGQHAVRLDGLMAEVRSFDFDPLSIAV